MSDSATGPPTRPSTDLLDLAAELVDIPSVSHGEAVLATHVAGALAACPHLEVTRLGDSVVARTELGRRARVVLGGHLDTVPPFDQAGARVEGDTLFGLGAVDMKGGLAVLLDLARTLDAPAVDVTYLFYACEEVERAHNGLRAIGAARPELLRADAAVLAEPTGGVVEAGCQGTLRVELALAGRRAHTARPWQGVNAISRLGPVLTILAGYEPRRVVIDGCEFLEQLQPVLVSGGVAPNVVPDEALLTVNHRFAPDRDATAAVEWLRGLVSDVVDQRAGDRFTVVDWSEAAPPSLDHPLLGALVEATGRPPRAKLGWTDVATMWEAGVPATNYGPGDPLLAHSADERVSRAELDEVRAALGGLLLGSAAG